MGASSLDCSSGADFAGLSVTVSTATLQNACLQFDDSMVANCFIHDEF
jgi:hypothetical protein